MNAAPDLPDNAHDRIARLLDTGIARHGRAQRMRRRVTAAAAAALVLIGGSGFAWVIVASQSQQSRSAYCYSADHTDSRSTQVGIPDQQTQPHGRPMRIATPNDRIASALDLCASVWQAGVLGPRANPRLVVCSRSDEVLAVFPRAATDTRSDAELCTDLGLGVAR